MSLHDSENNGQTWRLLWPAILPAILFSATGQAQESLGTLRDNTSPALPASYHFVEYVFPEPDYTVTCTNRGNDTARIEEVFFSQTHRHSPDHPFHFLVGFRPALFQVAVTGEGRAPQVMVEGFMNGESLGRLCLGGPGTLPADIDLSVPDFSNYFSLTLPKDWVQPGLELAVSAGDSSRFLNAEELNVGPYTELNLVMFELDVMDYNLGPHRTPMIDNFIQEIASAIPASVVRYGAFPARLPLPQVVASNNAGQLVRLRAVGELADNDITNEGHINSITTLFMTSLHQSLGDYLSTIYFGNTLNLAPGGWGGGKSFVSPDFDDVYLHELGHALSLPHWGESAWELEDPGPFEFLYPYGGANDDGGGRGESWTFIQDLQAFVNPVCQYDARGVAGLESSDAMQRNNHCLEKRPGGPGPWDGFGDFSALAIYRYLVGGDVAPGRVPYRGEERDFQFSVQQGFPTMTLETGERVYRRHPLQPPEQAAWETEGLPGEEQLNTDVYLVYGTAHPTQAQANIVYAPVPFTGTLPPLYDPTDPDTLAAMRGDDRFLTLMGSPRDITLKLFYADGSVLHAVNPFQSFARAADYPGDVSIWRWDLSNFALVVPGDKVLERVEMYNRPLVVRFAGDTTEGNVRDPGQDITADNFMIDAVLMASYDVNDPIVKTLTANAIGNQVWFDSNGNGVREAQEPGIVGVRLHLLSDSDGDGLPDWEGYAGTAVTDENGQYRIYPVDPGEYTLYIGDYENRVDGTALVDLVVTSGFVESDTDINDDNNGRPGDQAVDGFYFRDTLSDLITLSADGEPRNDGDPGHPYFDLDSPGNMTVDFGFTPRNSVGDRVWHDLDRDGRQDFGEPGIAGVRVNLFEYDETEVSEYRYVNGVLTDRAGRYLFAGLAPGRYLVMINEVDNSLSENAPLYGMSRTVGSTTADDDRPLDSNGFSAQPDFPRLGPAESTVSGPVTLSRNGEPLHDGSKSASQFDVDGYDNLTIDFGFYYAEGSAGANAPTTVDAGTLTALAVEQPLSMVMALGRGASGAAVHAGASADGGLNTGTRFGTVDNVLLAGAITPEPADAGEATEVFVVVQQATDAGRTWYFRDAGGDFVPWSGRVQDLEPAHRFDAMDSPQAFELFNGYLDAGTYRFYLGYMREDGSGPLHFNAQAMRVDITGE